MDTTTYSSGEEEEEEEEDFIPTKTRKPYTITKLRERWTQDEHNRFLDALKLYGRAWQRIEEHIGSKTAVQIRSHAQKFFTKLEKEALVKGVPVGQALDIDIPPPRPKRKPSNPYPRKTGLGTSGSQLGARDGKCSSVSCLSTHKRVVNLDKEPSREKPGGHESTGNGDDFPNGNDCSEVLNLFHGTPCSTLLSSANRNPRSPTMACRNSCTCRESVSVRKIVHDDGAKNTLNFEMADASQEKPFQSEKTNEADQPEYVGTLPSNDMQATQNYPRHVPVHVLNASLGMASRTVSLDMPCQETVLNQVEGINHGHHPKPYFSYAVAASANTPHADLSTSTLSPTYPLFDPFHSNQDNYQANLEASSAFSGLIVSSLLQNPAAYAAASFAASFWPCANKEDCAGSAQCPVPTTLGGGGAFPSPSSSLPPSMAAIAAVTVAAATAWWAAHGLLPFCSTPPPPPSSPLLNGFNRKPDVSTAVNPTTVSEIINLADKRENEPPMRNQQLQQLELEYSEALQAQQQSALKLPTLFLVSEQSEGAKRNAGASASDNNKKSTTATAVVDPNKTKSVKLVDRSSCGSNTPSSSEVETDALGKHALEKAEEAFKEKKPDEISHPACDSNNCSCGRSSSSTSDSWKEVSEEGRLAFQALFSREVLPQSFSPSNDMKNKWNQKNSLEDDQQKNKDEKVEDGLELDLNIRMWESCCPSHRKTIGTMEIGQGKLKARRTGFKPYKRCSAEAKESLTGSSLCNQHEEKGSKRVRLDGEGSTWCLR